MEPTATRAFTARAGQYEGPLELLLDLIEKRKLLVNELSLAQVTDDFITHVRGGEEFPMEDATNFIAVAATLLLIKSRSLLPELELSDEEEDDVENLKRRLAVYEKTRDAARELASIFGHTVMVSAGERAPEPMFAPSQDLDINRLANALMELFAAREAEIQLPEARIRPMVSIEDIMETLRTRIEKALTLSFSEFTGSTKEKVEVIVSFLALLELVKQGTVDVEQGSAFNDIRIINANATVPHYG